MDPITEVIERLTGTEDVPATPESLSAEFEPIDDETLAELDEQILAHYRAVREGEVEGTDPTDTVALSRIRDARAAVLSETQRRFDAAAELAAQAAEAEAAAAALDAEMLGTPNEPETPDDGGDEPEVAQAAVTPAPAPEPEPAPEAAPEPVTVPLAAAHEPTRPSLEALAAASRPVEATPPSAPAVTRPRWQDLSGREVAVTEITERFTAAAEEMQAAAPGAQWKRPVVRLRADFPDELRLDSNDGMAVNSAKADRLTFGMDRPEAWQGEAIAPIVASGGWCAPLEPRYDVFTVAGAHRPFRAGLPTIGASRGGIRLARGIGIDDITVGGPATPNAAVGVWDAATDETPGESTKGSQTIACPAIVDVELQAIYRHYQVGNFLSRSWAERQQAFANVVMAAHARVSETELLDCVCDASLTITEAAVLGAARDLLVAFRQAKRQMISHQRIAPDTVLRLWIPEWVPSMMVADVNRQQASGELDALTVTEADMLAAIRGAGFNVGLYADGMTGGSGVWGDIADNTNLRNWPTTVQWLMYPEGSFLALDGGTLDLGVYRDSTLVGTNDFRVFAESFETCAFVGLPDAAICVTSTVCPNGESQVATDETGGVCTGS